MTVSRSTRQCKQTNIDASRQPSASLCLFSLPSYPGGLTLRWILLRRHNKAGGQGRAEWKNVPYDKIALDDVALQAYNQSGRDKEQQRESLCSPLMPGPPPTSPPPLFHRMCQIHSSIYHRWGHPLVLSTSSVTQVFTVRGNFDH